MVSSKRGIIQEGVDTKGLSEKRRQWSASRPTVERNDTADQVDFYLTLLKHGDPEQSLRARDKLEKWVQSIASSSLKVPGNVVIAKRRKVQAEQLQEIHAAIAVIASGDVEMRDGAERRLKKLVGGIA